MDDSLATRMKQRNMRRCCVMRISSSSSSIFSNSTNSKPVLGQFLGAARHCCLLPQSNIPSHPDRCCRSYTVLSCDKTSFCATTGSDCSRCRSVLWRLIFNVVSQSFSLCYLCAHHCLQSEQVRWALCSLSRPPTEQNILDTIILNILIIPCIQLSIGYPLPKHFFPRTIISYPLWTLNAISEPDIYWLASPSYLLTFCIICEVHQRRL